MKKLILLASIVSCVIVFYTGCSSDKADIVYPCDPYDTLNMKYRANVVPIMESNCYSCHGGATPSSGIRLDTYTDLKKRVTNGKLIAAITHTGTVTPMPQNQPMMSPCNINKIKAWVNAGALDN